MEIKEQIENMVKKLTQDKGLMDQFKSNPVKAVETVLGVDLPDELVEKVVTGVKAKLAVSDVSDALGSLKKLF